MTKNLHRIVNTMAYLLYYYIYTFSFSIFLGKHTVMYHEYYIWIDNAMLNNTTYVRTFRVITLNSTRPVAVFVLMLRLELYPIHG